MKVTIDTVSKIIEIEEATTKELEKLCKDYKGFKIQSKIIYNNYPYWYYTTPSYLEPPYIVTSDSGTVNYTYHDTLTAN